MPKLTCQTFGTLAVVATADYPPGTPADPQSVTPGQHLAAFAAVLRQVFDRTQDLTDVTFYLQPPGRACRESDGYTMADLLGLITPTEGDR